MTRINVVWTFALISGLLAVTAISRVTSESRVVLAAAPMPAYGGCTCDECVEEDGVNFERADSNCANQAYWDDSWSDDDFGGDVEIAEGMACNPGSTTTCQSDGGSPASWSCGSATQYPNIPDDPVYDGVDCNGYLVYETNVEEDFGPYGLPSDDDGNNYDQCNLGNCYISYDVESISNGEASSEDPSFCYDEDCSFEMSPSGVAFSRFKAALTAILPW